MDNIELINNVIKYFGVKENHHVFLSTGTSLFEDVKKIVYLLKNNNYLYLTFLNKC